MDAFRRQIPPELFEDLQRIIASTQPALSILIAGSDAAKPCMALFDGMCCDRFLPDQIKPDEDKRYDLGIAWCLNSELPRRQADHQIANLRDCLCKRLYLYEKIDGSVVKSELCGHLKALGLHLMKTYGNIAAFYFDIYDYKDVPDWLNSDFWANPELWEKARW